MSLEATRSQSTAFERALTLESSIQPSEVWQLPNGSVGVYIPTGAGTSGDRGAFSTVGVFVMPKETGVALLDGGRAYWDHSANRVTYRKVNDRDFYIGRVVGDAAAADTTCAVELNVDPRYDIELGRDPFISVPVGTFAAGGFDFPRNRGGCWVLDLTATNEAQKVDLISRDGFVLAANPIVEFAFCIEANGTATGPEFNIGVASDTHSTDFQSITRFVSIHTQGNSTTIFAQSDDDVTDVNPTNTTKTHTVGTAVSNRVECWLDFRNPASVKIYVNGERVLTSTTFSAGLTQLVYLIAHLRKPTSTQTYRAAIDWLRVRLSEQ